MQQEKIKPHQFRYIVHTFTICDGWINCWTVTECNNETRYYSFQTITEAEAEISELEDPENYRIFDSVTNEYVGHVPLSPDCILFNGIGIILLDIP